MQLRPYQKTAVDSLLHYWRTRPEGQPIICAPTGSGKSRILAEVCRLVLAKRPHYRIVVATHRKELIEQNAAHLYALLQQPIGIYSAGLGSRTMRSVTCAGIQSIYKKQLDAVQLLIIDECHLLSPDEGSMYQQFIRQLRAGNPALKILGLSATPYRVDQGSLIGAESIFTDICYDVGIKPLIAGKFLAPVVSRVTAAPVDFADVRRSGADYAQQEMENKMLPLSAAHCAEIVRVAADRRKILVFCSGIAHALAVADFLRGLGVEAAAVHSEMMPMERDQILARFKSGSLRALCNVGILTTGFDFPALDCIAILRATKSASLYVQMVGRGMRTAEGKADCLVLDFGGNILRHGCIDQIQVRQKGAAVEISHAPQKECPECHIVVPIAAKSCGGCGYQFPPASCRVTQRAETAPIISEPEILPVDSTEYRIHRKGGIATNTPMLRIDYRIGLRTVSDFLCFEHRGYAAAMAIRKWHSLQGAIPAPRSAQEAFNRSGELVRAAEIEVKREGRYYRLIKIVTARTAADDAAEEIPGLNI